MKFKTIHNELEFNKKRTIEKHVLVRANQVPKLKTIIDQASRGTAPSNIKFATLANDGFIPPQYSREDITSLHKRYKDLTAEHSNLQKLSQSKSVSTETNPTPPEEETE